jgi:predicted outer membrane repeat protein
LAKKAASWQVVSLLLSICCQQLTLHANETDASDWAGLVAECNSSGSVTLSPDFEMGNYTGAIEVGADELVIWGNNAILDTGGLTQGHWIFFDWRKLGNNHLELHNLVLQNGWNLGGFGGAILFSGILSIFNCTFKNNQALSGGAIATSGDHASTLIIEDSTFDSNVANPNSVSHNGGGAIWASNGGGDPNITIQIKIFSSTFKNNSRSPQCYGGAIAVWHGALWINDTLFVNNLHEDHILGPDLGGAIYLTGVIDDGYAGSVTAEILASTFQANSLLISDGFLAVYNTSFEDSNITFRKDFNENARARPPALGTFTSDCTFRDSSIIRSDGTSDVTFTCADNQCGPSVNMLSQLSTPSTLLRCSPASANYFCNTPRGTEIPQCIANAQGDYNSCSTCHASCAAAPNPQRRAQEQAALDKFYESTKGVDGWLHACGDGWPKPGGPSTDVCTRNGVTCDRSQQFVLELKLNGCGLTGTIPSGSIFSIRGLTDINLANEIYAGRAPLAGMLPADLPSAVQLQSLTLNSNKITGTVPDLSKLTMLKLIDLHYNDLSGPLPALASPSIGYISFAGNSFTCQAGLR